MNNSNSFSSIFTSVLLTCERVINFSIPSPMTISWSEPSGIMDISRFPQYVPTTSGAVITASSSGGFPLSLLSLSSSSLLQAAKKVREQTNANKYNRFFFIRLWFSYYNKFVPYKLKRRKKVQYASFFEDISSSQLSYRKLCYICI